MSRVVILLDSNGQCSTQHHKAYKQESATLSKEKKSTETVPEKDLMVDIRDKDFKTTILKMLKEVKEDMEKVKK